MSFEILVRFGCLVVCFSTGLGKVVKAISDRGRESPRSYVTGDLSGCPGSLEWDGIQPEVIAASSGLLPRVSVGFLDGENREPSEQGVRVPQPACC